MRRNREATAAAPGASAPGQSGLDELCGLLRVSGPTSDADLATLCARGADAAGELLSAGLAVRRTVAGTARLALSPRGLERAEAWRAAEAREVGVLLAAAYAEFAAPNAAVKQALTRWQMRSVGATSVPNDHADARYDAAVLDELAAALRGAAPLLAQLAALRPRYERVGAALREALRAAERGMRDRVAGLRADSLHAVWWRLHAELLWILARERDSDDA